MLMKLLGLIFLFFYFFGLFEIKSFSIMQLWLSWNF